MLTGANCCLWLTSTARTGGFCCISVYRVFPFDTRLPCADTPRCDRGIYKKEKGNPATIKACYFLRKKNRKEVRSERQSFTPCLEAPELQQNTTLRLEATDLRIRQNDRGLQVQQSIRRWSIFGTSRRNRPRVVCTPKVSIAQHQNFVVWRFFFVFNSSSTFGLPTAADKQRSPCTLKLAVVRVLLRLTLLWLHIYRPSWRKQYKDMLPMSVPLLAIHQHQKGQPSFPSYPLPTLYRLSPVSWMKITLLQ